MSGIAVGKVHSAQGVRGDIFVLIFSGEAAWADQNIPDIDEFVARASTDARAAVRAQLQELRAELIETDVLRGRQLDPVALLRALGTRGLTRVFCEGGGALVNQC